MKVNALALSTIEKLLRKLITHCSTLHLHCVQFQVWFASLFAAAHWKSGLQVSGCLHISKKFCSLNKSVFLSEILVVFLINSS